MILKKELLRNFKLYLIIDKQISNIDIQRILKAVSKVGVDVIQYRDKTSSLKQYINVAKTAAIFCKRHKIPFIVNDRAEAVLQLDAEGLHLGQNDMPVSLARKLFPEKIIGQTCNNLEQAKDALNNGVDYLGVGSVFSTKTKQDSKPVAIPEVKKIINMGIPVFAIGGIKQENISYLLQNNIKRIAVSSAVCLSQNPEIVLRNLKAKLEK